MPSIDTAHWSEEAQEIFEPHREERMPLVHGGKCGEAGRRLLKISPEQLFPQARSPRCVLAGVLLQLGCWNEAHDVAQDIDDREGSYWHAMIHRMEPDGWNSNYWFRRVGTHPIFPQLHAEALHLVERYPTSAFRLAETWNPAEFIRFCEQAAAQPGSELEALAREIQQAEWALLLGWCAK
jgi:hypothetical protein